MADIKGIVLKNIDLTGISRAEQFDKTKEEQYEFNDAILNYMDNATKENRKHAIEEYFDVMQSALGILQKFGISAEDVMKEYPKHLEKLKSRPRKKECKKCIYKLSCCLYLSEYWTGNSEAEKCKTYSEQEE